MSAGIVAENDRKAAKFHEKELGGAKAPRDWDALKQLAAETYAANQRAAAAFEVEKAMKGVSPRPGKNQ